MGQVQFSNQYRCVLIMYRLFEKKNRAFHRSVEKRILFGSLSKQPLKLVLFSLQQGIASKVDALQDQVLPISNRDTGPETSLPPLKKYLSIRDYLSWFASIIWFLMLLTYMYLSRCLGQSATIEIDKISESYIRVVLNELPNSSSHRFS